MLTNAYFLAKFRFGTAENEPAKNLQNLQKIAKFPRHRALGRRGPERQRGDPRRDQRARGLATPGEPHRGQGWAVLAEGMINLTW